MPKQRTDHFQKNLSQRNTPDFNFNINFGDQSQVAEIAQELGQLLKVQEDSQGLKLFHDPIPPEWLHLTMWYGSTKEYALDEVLQAAELLKPALTDFQMPEAQLSTWWQPDRAVPMLDVTPKEPFQQLSGLTRQVMQRVVGINRVPEPKEPYDAHVTTIYPTTYERTEKADSVVKSVHVDPVTFTVNSLVLVTQHWDDSNNPNHYVWEVIEEIPIGRK